jgi:hypothetical protein
MKQDPVYWDNHPLGPGPVALVVVPAGPDGPTSRVPSMLGAACAEGGPVFLVADQFAPFLRAHSRGELVCHDAARLHRLLHESLSERKDAGALSALWGFSRESRLLDVMLLDQRIRLFYGEDGSRGRPLTDLTAGEEELPDDTEVRRRVAVALALPCIFAPENADTLLLLMRVAVALLRAFRRLSSKAEEIGAGAEVISRPPSFQPRPLSDQERQRLGSETASARQADQDGRQARPPYGLCGLGIEVQAVIAARHLERRGLCVAGGRWQEARRHAERAFEEASADIYKEVKLRPLFLWEKRRRGKVVQRRGSTGEVATSGAPFLKWLRDAVPDQLRDIYHRPAPLPFPASEPPADPEQWPDWADAHPGFRAFRRLVRAARVAAFNDDNGTLRLTYQVVPRLQSAPISLRAVGGLADPVFTPRDGHRFLIGALEDLRARCLAVLCRQSRYAFHGSLRVGFLDGLEHDDSAVPSGAVGAFDLKEDEPGVVEALAVQLFAHGRSSAVEAAQAAVDRLSRQETPEQQEAREACDAAYQCFLAEQEQRRLAGPSQRTPCQPSARRDEGGPPTRRKLVPSPARRAWELAQAGYEEARDTPALRAAKDELERAREAAEAAEERFLLSRGEGSAEYGLWVRRARALLEATPLGLEHSLLLRLLRTGRQEDWEGVSADDLQRYQLVLARKATELAAFLDLDLVNRLAENLGQPTRQIIEDLLNNYSPEHMTQAVLHDLETLDRARPVWELIERTPPAELGAGGNRPSADESATRLSWWMALTPAGRVIGPDAFVPVRREQYLAAADEVMKAVAYALIASGYALVAVTDDEFVLEVPEVDFASPAPCLRRVEDVVSQAQRPLLGRLAAPSRWRPADAW